jgi:limonene-1,2-epoxide hydrolase
MAVNLTDTPESVVRGFLASWADPVLDKVVSFFADDAVFVDGPRGVHRGVNSIRSQLEVDLRPVRVDVKSLVTDGRMVMLERVDSFDVEGKGFSMEVMAAFVIDSDGLIKRWRESYDLQSITDQIEAAGFKVPG